MSATDMFFAADAAKEVVHVLRTSLRRAGLTIAKKSSERGVHIIKSGYLVYTIEVRSTFAPGTERDTALATVPDVLFKAGYAYKQYDHVATRHWVIMGRRQGAALDLEGVPACTECGRFLSDAESIARGKGPECAKKQPFPLDV